MILRLHHPTRDVQVDAPIRACDLCQQFGYNRESVLVLRDDSLVLGDVLLHDEDHVEIIIAMSGG